MTLRLTRYEVMSPFSTSTCKVPDPGALHLLNGLYGSANAFLDGVLEALRGLGNDFDHLGD